MDSFSERVKYYVPSVCPYIFVFVWRCRFSILAFLFFPHSRVLASFRYSRSANNVRCVVDARIIELNRLNPVDAADDICTDEDPWDKQMES